MPAGTGRGDRGSQTLAAAFSAVVRHVDDGIVIVDDDDRIASINRFLARAAGVAESEAVGRRASSLIGWTEADATTAKPLTTSVVLRTDQGDRRCAAVVLPVERENGGRLRIVIVHEPAEPAPAALSDFERRVLDILRRQRATGPAAGTSGHIEVIMIDAVKQHMGPRWRTVSERVMGVAATMIEQRLALGEACTRIADTSFIVAFATRDLDEAARRAEAIAADILTHLLGDSEAAGNFVVNASAAPLDEWPVGDPSVGGGTLRHAEAGLDLRIAASRDSYRERVARGIAALIRDAGLSCRVVLRQGRASGLLLAELDAASLAAEAGLRQAGVFPRTHPEVGLLRLTLSIDRLYRALDEIHGPPPVMVVPLSFAMLSDRHGVEQFLALARPLPPALRRQLILMVTGLARDTPRSRLTDIAQRLAPFCRRVSAAIDGLDDAPIDYPDFRPTGLLVQWTPDLAQEIRQNGDRLRRLSARAHRHNCLIVVQGAADALDRKRLEAEFAVDLIVDEAAPEKPTE
ncbi:hypothetical protein L2U69_14685 [Zavarzinia compransoris]|uniref:hypothetical protein n=1 Tax=Zavarzinia marina TaxID=2911065 RepID=UPI001F31D384|nr:hypothetical protein [Zavarzinia marina]MCF4166896.1 hypothetical protein [Zavarzinia marina]